MMNILKYVRGYLRIRVSGFSPERFMNLCSNKDILLWDIVQENDCYIMCISLRSFYKIKSIVRKTRTKVVILERRGLPFLFPVMRKRSVFLGGLVFAILFWYVSGYFVWDIEVLGNQRITSDQLETFLEEKGIHEGMKKKDLEIGILEKEIRKSFSLVTWTSARLDGTKLLISIKENDAPILDEQENQGSVIGTDLVSEYEGTIVSMVVRKGVPKVKIGDEVAPGTILVDGKVPVYNEDATVREYILTDADADIVLKHGQKYETSLPFDYVEHEYTGRTKIQKFLRIGSGNEYKIPVEQPFLSYDRIMRQSRPALFEKINIPIYVGSYTYREYQNVEHEYSLEQAETLLQENLLRFLQTLEEKGVQIIEKDVKIDTDDCGWILQGEFCVQEKIGKRTETDRGDEIIEEE